MLPSRHTTVVPMASLDPSFMFLSFAGFSILFSDCQYTRPPLILSLSSVLKNSPKSPTDVRGSAGEPRSGGAFSILLEDVLQRELQDPRIERGADLAELGVGAVGER